MGNALAPLITNRVHGALPLRVGISTARMRAGIRLPYSSGFGLSLFIWQACSVASAAKGDAWMVETKEERNGYNMVFLNTDASIKLQNNAVRSNGIPVRPEKE